MSWEPHVIGCDGGSTDPGPYYLGSGKSFTLRAGDEARPAADAARGRAPASVPLHHRHLRRRRRRAAPAGAPSWPARSRARRGCHFRMALIHAEQDKELLIARASRAGRQGRSARWPPLDAATVERAERIVGMMGPEPFARALDDGAQVVLAGRSSDPAPWAAPAHARRHAARAGLVRRQDAGMRRRRRPCRRATTACFVTRARGPRRSASR